MDDIPEEPIETHPLCAHNCKPWEILVQITQLPRNELDQILETKKQHHQIINNKEKRRSDNEDGRLAGRKVEAARNTNPTMKQGTVNKYEILSVPK